MLHMIFSRRCPRCEGVTHRTQTPWYARPLRWVLPNLFSVRTCSLCGWKGVLLFKGRHGSSRREWNPRVVAPAEAGSARTPTAPSTR